jgi:hypothetical protein
MYLSHGSPRVSVPIKNNPTPGGPVHAAGIVKHQVIPASSYMSIKPTVTATNAAAEIELDRSEAGAIDRLSVVKTRL